MNKKKVIGIVIIVVLILALVGGVLYFTMSNEKTINDLEVKYKGGASVKINGKDSTLEKEVVIKNTSNDLKTYKLSWEDVSNDFGSNLVYEITCSGERCASLASSQVPVVGSTIYNSVAIPSGVTHTYKIKFTNKEAKDGTFKGKLKVVSESKKSSENKENKDIRENHEMKENKDIRDNNKIRENKDIKKTDSNKA